MSGLGLGEAGRWQSLVILILRLDPQEMRAKKTRMPRPWPWARTDWLHHSYGHTRRTARTVGRDGTWSSRRRLGTGPVDMKAT